MRTVSEAEAQKSQAQERAYRRGSRPLESTASTCCRADTRPRTPTPTMWLDECVSPSAHSRLPSQRSDVSRGTVETSASYQILEPSCSVTVCCAASSDTTRLRKRCCAAGRSAATPFQIAPVPPRLGNLHPAPLSCSSANRHRT